MMATPFALVALAFALQLALRGPAGVAWGRPGALAELALAALVLGALYAINSPRLPDGDRARRPRPADLGGPSSDARSHGGVQLVWALAWLAASLVLFLPFWLDFSPTASGIGVVGDHDNFTPLRGRRAAHLRVAALDPRRWPSPSGCRSPCDTSCGAAWSLMFVLVLLLAARLAGLAARARLVACCALRRARVGAAPAAAAVLLAAARPSRSGSRDRGVRLHPRRLRRHAELSVQHRLQGRLPGLVPARDRRERGGVLPCDGGFGPPLRAVAWLGGLAVLVALAARLSGGGVVLALRGVLRPPTLDGDTLARQRPDDAAAIRWLRANVEGTPVVLEDAGADFEPGGPCGRVSTFTGLPAVIGWGGHEVQWGHDPARARETSQRIYETPIPAWPGAARALRRALRVRGLARAGRTRPPRSRSSSRLGRVVFGFGEDGRLRSAARLSQRACAPSAAR